MKTQENHEENGHVSKFSDKKDERGKEEKRINVECYECKEYGQLY